jgi:8-oxo-dGTP diphosphatase
MFSITVTIQKCNHVNEPLNDAVAFAKKPLMDKQDFLRKSHFSRGRNFGYLHLEFLREYTPHHMNPNTSIRKTIRDIVSSIKPIDELENAHVDFVLKWIDSGVELCRIQKPATPPIHLVSYFLVFDPKNHAFLLVDHKKAGLWLPSGGHVEQNEHPRYTVTRECLEELGMEAAFLFDEPYFLTVSQTVGSTAGHTDVSLWYVLKGNSALPIDFDSEEFHGVQWFDLDDIPYERSDPHMKRFIDKFSQHILNKSEK